MIPNSIQNFQSGIPGTIALTGDITATTYRILSADPGDNIFGRAFTYVDEDDGVVGAGAAGTTFAGIMISPGEFYTGRYTEVIPGLQVPAVKPNGSEAAFLRKGFVHVKLYPGTADPGDAAVPAIGSKIYYMADGTLTVDDDEGGANPAVFHTEIVGASVEAFSPAEADIDGGQLAIISLIGRVPA